MYRLQMKILFLFFIVCSACLFLLLKKRTPTLQHQTSFHVGSGAHIDIIHPAAVNGFLHGDSSAFLSTPYKGIDLPPPPAVFLSEILSVYHSDRPEPTGVQASAWAMKTQGKYYISVQANVVVKFNGTEKLLLSRRSSRKWVWPLALDFAVAETMLPGETYYQAVVRGVQEEFGIDISAPSNPSNHQHDSKLRVDRVTPLDGGVARANCWKGRMPHMKLFDCYWGVTFQVVLSGDIEHKLTLQKDEVDSTLLLNFHDANLLIMNQSVALTHWFIESVYSKKIPGFEIAQEFSERCAVQCLPRKKEERLRSGLESASRDVKIQGQFKNGTRRFDECRADCIKALSIALQK